MNPFSRSHKDKIAGDAASILQEATSPWTSNTKDVEGIPELSEDDVFGVDEEYSSDEVKVLKKIGFKEAPVGKSTYDSSKGVKALYGLPLKGGKWLPDAWVGEYDNGTYFVSGLEGTMDFNKSAGLINHLKKVALGESVVEESVFRESNKSDEIKSLEDLIKNPDPARIKQYGGGTKYVDMLRAKLDKLTNESSNLKDLDEKRGPTAYMKKVEKAMASDTEED